MNEISIEALKSSDISLGPCQVTYKYGCVHTQGYAYAQKRKSQEGPMLLPLATLKALTCRK